MKTVISACLASLLAFFAFQGGTEVVPLDIDPINPLELKLLNESEVVLINMIPRSLGEEHDQNSEPFLAVHSNQSLMIGAVFQGKLDPRNGATPITLLSTDKGLTWQPRPLLPGKRVGSQTYCFSGKGESFYGSVSTIAGEASRSVSVFHAANPATDQLENVSTLTSGTNFGDSPFIQAGTSGPTPAEGETDNRVDRVFVGQNYFGLKPRTASVRVSADGKAFRLLGLEARDTGVVEQDAPPVIPAIASDDTVYVAFIHWDAISGNLFRGDVVVSRDDESARGASSFRALVDPSDGLPGRIVEKGRFFSFYERLGQQRVISPLSLAVDPVHSEIVFVAWGEYDAATKTHNLRLRKSTDRGQNWSEDLRKIPSATNPALAVSEGGVVGLLYQQLLPKTSSELERWETHFLKSEDGGSIWTDVPLATIPTQNMPASVSDPYLGYRTHLLAIKANFYGIFSAHNEPNPKHFPQGVKFQRNYHNGNLLSDNGEEIIPGSIDPYFFRISGQSRAMATQGTFVEKNPSLGSSTALALKYGLPLGLVTLAVLAVIGTIQLFRARKVSRTLDEKIHGSAVTNYQGFVAAYFTDAEGVPIEQIEPGSRYRLIVQFSHEKPQHDFFEEIDLQGGEVAREVMFVLATDSPDFEVVPDHKTVYVPAKGSLEVDFDAIASQANEGKSLFVQIFQRTRLVQVVVPRLARISEAV